MNCFNHDRVFAVGVCALCQKAICRDCVGAEWPRLVCQACAQRRTTAGFEYRTTATIGGWPILHICAGVDPVTMQPRVAKGIIAIGNIAVGVVAIAALACGVFTVGGASLGLLFALGGAAVGVGVSVGGLAIGSVAIGGAALGFLYAVGGAAFAPSVIDGHRCDPAALEFFRQWLGSSVLPPTCR